jgi:hypothetical protein
MVDFNKLIPELSLWNNGKGINAKSWINGIGNFEHAIAYTTIFWPGFIEYDDCVFQTDHFDKHGYRDWLTHTSGNKEAVEKVMNHLHLRDLFPNTNEATNEQVSYLAEILKQMWECKLRHDFPDRKIVVLLTGDYDLQITFYQPREKLNK